MIPNFLNIFLGHPLLTRNRRKLNVRLVQIVSFLIVTFLPRFFWSRINKILNFFIWVHFEVTLSWCMYKNRVKTTIAIVVFQIVFKYGKLEIRKQFFAGWDIKIFWIFSEGLIFSLMSFYPNPYTKYINICHTNLLIL